MRFVGWTLGEQNKIFFATLATNDIFFAQAFAQCHGGLGQHQVAAFVAVAVIDLLEEIDFAHDQGVWPVVVVIVPPVVSHVFQEGAAIFDFG